MGTVASFGEGKYRVFAEAIAAGDDLLVYLGGGEKPHIGGASYSEPSGQPVSFSIPRHKDYIVSHEVSEKICKMTGKRCLVVVGIHVDRASKEEIAILVRNALRCADLLVNELGA